MEVKKDMWMMCFSFMVEELFGPDFLLTWETMTEASSLQDIAEGEEPFDFDLSEWEKKLFLISEVVNQKITLIKKGLEGKPLDKLKEEDRAHLKEHFQYQKLGGAFRGLFFSILWRLHPETQGPWNVGIRKEFKVVKAPINIEPGVIPVNPEQLQGILKQIKEGKPPGRLN